MITPRALRRAARRTAARPAPRGAPRCGRRSPVRKTRCSGPSPNARQAMFVSPLLAQRTEPWSMTRQPMGASVRDRRLCSVPRGRAAELRAAGSSSRPPPTAVSTPTTTPSCGSGSSSRRTAEMEAVQARFGLHPLAVEDAFSDHQRPKLETYGDDTFFIVLRSARYDDAREEVDFGEVALFMGPGYVVTVRRGEAGGADRARASASTSTPRSPRPVRPPWCGPCSTASSTTTARWWKDSRTTSRRSRPASSRSAPTRRSGSTSCAARSSSSTARCTPCSRHSTRWSSARSAASRTACAPGFATSTTTSSWSTTRCSSSATC